MLQHVYFRVLISCLAVYAIMACIPALVFAGTIEKTIPRNKPTALMPLFSYGADNCGAYPVQDLKITTAPRHGAIIFMMHSAELPAETGVCQGSKVNIKWLVYQPAANYSGPDRISISYNRSAYENNVRQVYTTKDFEITVK